MDVEVTGSQRKVEVEQHELVIDTKKPALELLRKTLENDRIRILKLQDIKDCGLSTPEIRKQLRVAKSELHSKELKIKRLVDDAERSRKRHLHQKTVVQELAQSHGDAVKKFNRGQRGRPTLETEQSELHSTIISLVTNGAGADRRRRTDILNACLTLDDLVFELKKFNINLSRSALYLRLIPHRAGLN